MATATIKYVVTTEEGTQEFSNLGLVGKFLGKKITKRDVEAGKYPMVSLQDASDEDTDLQHKAEFTKLEQEQEDKALLSKFDTEEQQGIEVPSDVDSPAPAVDEKTQYTLDMIGKAINDTPEDDNELFDALCNLEDAVTDGAVLTQEQADLLVKVLTNTLNEDASDTVDTGKGDEDVPPTPPSDVEYPEVGGFKDEKAMKKFIKGLSDASLEEWCILEGVEWKHNDHQAINRMRMAMAIKGLHFPSTVAKKGKKSKSKYSQWSTEELVQMALDNDVEVPDDKGDARILRMYTIMALRKANIID